MQKIEFEKRTGIFPSDEMWKVIESEYMDSEIDKNEFCQKYVKNEEGIAEKIQLKTDEKRYKQYIECQKKIDLLNGELNKKQDEIILLSEKLDRELEWKPYKELYSEKEYNILANDKYTHELSTYEAKVKIHQWFGFDFDSLDIITKYNIKEINRHGAFRSTGEISLRKPIYNSTDYNYILFSACGYEYECVDGELYMLKC